MLLTFVVSAHAPTVAALPAEELHSIYNDTPWYRVGGNLGCGATSSYSALFPGVGNISQLADGMSKYITDVNNGSPLIDYVDEFISAGQKHNVNPVMVLGIALKDTSLATAGHGKPPKHNFGNIRGGDDGTGFHSYANYPEAIEAHFSHLRSDLYLGPPSNFTTVDEVINRWAPPEDKNDTTGYIRDVKELMSKILGNLGLSQTNINCACGQGGLPGDGGNTVVIDPGHGPNRTKTDEATGLRMIESHNVPETEEVWDVSQRIKKKLEGNGYKVVLTKQSALDQVTFRERANIANDNRAAVAVSVHNDHGQNYGSFKQVWPQKVGQYRENQSGDRTTFDNAAVATTSQKYAQTMKEEREKVEGGNVVVTEFSTKGRAIDQGNIPMVMLFSKVPWVYHEVGARGDMSESEKEEYATGIANGIKNSVPLVAGGTPVEGENASCACTDAIMATAKEYSWETFSKVKTEMKPAYQAAVQAPDVYQGGSGGVDCGAFVTRAMIDSGADPGYNNGGKYSTGAGATQTQYDYLEAQVKASKYEFLGQGITDTSKLMPGDIAITPQQHTYIFAGDKGYKGYDSFSASLGDRAPMASSFQSHDSNGLGFYWYRIKCATGAPADPADPPSGTCVEGTIDVGVHDGYRNGEKIRIRLCAVKDLKINDFTNEEGKESTSGNKYSIKGANGLALVEASVSAQVVKMVRAAKKDGVNIQAFSSFRTHEHQIDLCGASSGNCPNGGYASPGHSRHQLGTAIDFVDSNRNRTANCQYDSRGYCHARGDPTWEWLTKNAADYGYKQLKKESWHWSPDGQ